MYTINRGMMDEWVKLFTQTLLPMQEKHGIKIEGMWVSECKLRTVFGPLGLSLDNLTQSTAGSRSIDAR